jgi:MipA family protein
MTFALNPAARAIALAALATALTATLTTAHAQDMGGDGGPQRNDVDVSLGFGPSAGPAYAGSDDNKVRALPLIQARWRNGFFAGTTGLGYRWGGTEPLSGGLRLGIDPGRDQDDSADLRGMGDIPLRPELGAFFNYKLVPAMTLSGGLRYGSGDDRKGLRGDLALTGMLPISPEQRVLITISTQWANQAAQQSAFGVSAAQSLRSGYAVYTPGAGLRDVGLRLGYGHTISPKLSLMLGLQFTHLLGDAADSPLTRRSTGVGANAMLMWRL